MHKEKWKHAYRCFDTRPAAAIMQQLEKQIKLTIILYPIVTRFRLLLLSQLCKGMVGAFNIKERHRVTLSKRGCACRDRRDISVLYRKHRYRKKASVICVSLGLSGSLRNSLFSGVLLLFSIGPGILKVSVPVWVSVERHPYRIVSKTRVPSVSVQCCEGGSQETWHQLQCIFSPVWLLPSTKSYLHLMLLNTFEWRDPLRGDCCSRAATITMFPKKHTHKRERGII